MVSMSTLAPFFAAAPIFIMPKLWMINTTTGMERTAPVRSGLGLVAAHVKWGLPWGVHTCGGDWPYWMGSRSRFDFDALS